MTDQEHYEALIERHNSVVLAMQQQMEDAVAAEREACAKICDALCFHPDEASCHCAAAIRARG